MLYDVIEVSKIFCSIQWKVGHSSNRFKATDCGQALENQNIKRNDVVKIFFFVYYVDEQKLSEGSLL